MTARHHHYLSQCYLRGFTKGGGKKSKLAVIDLREGRNFATIPRNVGGIRDFNRFDVEGVDPNVLENALSSFETSVASALRALNSGELFEGETRELILNLIALVAVRNPAMRENWRQFHAQVVERVMDLALASRERWESQMRQMKESGEHVNERVTYEDAKAFFESKQYTIEVARERHIHNEFALIEKMLPLLDARKWLLVRRAASSGPFVTTDHPVTLTWKELEKIPSVYRYSPGYGMKDTQVYVPISKDVALLGEFEGPEGEFEANEPLVALLNAKALWFAEKQAYAPSMNFPIYAKDGEIVDARQIFRRAMPNQAVEPTG